MRSGSMFSLRLLAGCLLALSLPGRLQASTNAVPEVTNDVGATSITATSATLSGAVLAGAPTPNAWIFWGTTDGGTDVSAWEITNDFGIQSGSFSTNVTGLITGQGYFYRTYASNDQGEAWANDSAFFMPVPSVAFFMTNSAGDETTASVELVVTQSVASLSAVTVDYAVSGGTATGSGTDYTLASGSVTIPAGNVSTSIVLTVSDDSLDENDETVEVTLSNPVNASLGTEVSHTYTITDDDATPSLSIGDLTLSEGDSGSTTAVLTVTLSAASGLPVQFAVTSSNGTAASGSDYTATNRVVSIPAGETTTNVMVDVLGDVVDEDSPESFFMNLSGEVNASIADADGQIDITDDDPAPTISVSDVTITEGDSGETQAVFAVTLSGASALPVQFDFVTSNGTATAGSDYTATNVTVTIPAGQTATNLMVAVLGDVLDEASPETFYVNLGAAVNGTISDGEGQGNITDDDPTPTLSISDVTITEGDAGSTQAVFAVTLSATSGQNVQFNFASSNGTAVAGVDYTATNGTVTISAGQTTGLVSVAVTGDLLDEVSPETFFVSLSAATNATFADGLGQGDITDDDATPTLSISDVTITEGDAGTTQAVFAVTLSAASGQNVQFDFASSNGTALAGSDYTATNGTITISAGQTTGFVAVAVLGDLLDEVSPEDFFVNVSAVTNATVTDGEGQGNITDDDVTPTLSVGDVTITEGDAGSTSAVFTVTLSAVSGQAVQFQIASSNGTGIAGADYTATNRSLTIPAGQTTTNFAVAVVGDLLDEVSPETFFVNLSGPTNATLLDAQGQANITDDDATPTLSISDVTITEGDAGSTQAVFAVTLSAASGQNVQFNFASSNGTGTAGADYTATNGTVTISAGQTTGLVSVAVSGDLLDEVSPETFFVNLSAATNATFADGLGQGNITDDDPTPTLSIDDITYQEGNAGSTTAVFTVTLSAASGQTVQFQLATSNGTGTAGNDYVATNRSMVFLSGVTSTNFAVTVNGDVLDELSPETFFVNISGVTNATIADGTGQGNITDDDATPTMSISDVTITEGDAGSTQAVFAVTLSATSGQNVQFNFASSNGTALAGADYTATNGAVTISAGQTTGLVSVAVTGDLLDEVSPETFFVNLSAATNATVADGSGQGDITDDDATPTLAVSDVTITEGDSGSTSALVTVTLSAASGQDVQFGFASSNGTAVSGADYTATNGTGIILAGQTNVTVPVTILADVLDEDSPETLFVNFTSPSNASFTDAQSLINITDDDATPTLSISDSTVTEGNSGTTQAVFTITLSAPSGRAVTFLTPASNGTARASLGDFLATNKLITFQPGETVTSMYVTVFGDSLGESSPEIFYVNLSTATSAPMNATLADGQGQGNIIDDDTLPSLTIGDYTVTEGNAGTTTAVFLVNLSAPPGQNVQFTFASSNGTAESGSDYVATNGTVTILNGTNLTTNVAISVVVNGDVFDEVSNETFFVNILSITNATIADGQAQGNIADDDATPTLSISDATVTEGDTGFTNAVFTISLSAASGRDVFFIAASSNGAATTAASDYIGTNIALSISAGQTSTNLPVSVLADLLGESNETFFVNLTGVSNATPTDVEGQGTILDNDVTPMLSISDATVTEGNAGSTSAVFTITLSTASVDTVQFFLTTSNGTAVGGADFLATNLVVSIPPGQTATNFKVQVFGDLLDEASTDTFFMNISAATGLPMNATLVDSQGQGNIVDDDATPTLVISDFAVSEGNAGSTSAVLTVNLSAISGQNVQFNFGTSNGTAEAGTDFTATNGSLTILAGQTNAGISVVVLGDVFDEASPETFFVNLTAVSNATPTDPEGQVSIADDDATPTISVGDAAVTEGNGGSTSAVFTISLSAISGRDVFFTIASSNGTAVSFDGDYIATNLALSIQAGQMSTNLPVSVLGDFLGEPTETFFVNLSGVSNATPADIEGQATITDDDVTPVLSIGDATVTEGNTGSVAAVFTISLSTASVDTVQFFLTTSNGTAIGAADFLATNFVVSIPAGQTTTNITIPVFGDVLDEASTDTFFLMISTATGLPMNATLFDGEGAGNITDDDATPTMSIGDFAVSEGDSGSTTAVFTVNISEVSGQSIQFIYTTSNGTATGGADFTSTNGTVLMPAGQTNAVVPVTVLADVLDEASPEIFYVNLLSGSNAVLVDAQAQGSIADDDATPTISINDISLAEGNSGTTSAVFTISLSAVSGRDVIFTASSSNGTALSFDGDYTSTNVAVTILAGQPSTTFSVDVTGDLLGESNETFFVNLSGESGATLLDGQGQCTVMDDDLIPLLSISDATLTEGNAGTTVAVFTVSLSTTSVEAVQFQLSTSNGTALGGADYVTTNGIVTIGAGETMTNFLVSVNGDTLYELSNDTFYVNVTSVSGIPMNANISDGEAQGNITDDDPVPTLTISDAGLTEGNSGITSMVFVVNLSAYSGLNVQFDYATSNGSAEAGTDYMATNGTLTIIAGQTNLSISADVFGDTASEATETFYMLLNNPSNATFADAQGQGAIANDEESPGITIDDVTITEGDAGATSAVFTVTLGAPSAKTVIFTVLTSNNTATSGTDFNSFSNTYSLASGATTTNFSILVKGDLFTESNETFFVNLVSVTNADLDDVQGECTVVDNDQFRTGGVTQVSSPLSFEGQVYSEISNKVMTVSNAGGAVLSYSIASDSFWLSVTNSSGSLAPGVKTNVAVYIATRGLAARPLYEGHLTITTPQSVHNVPEVQPIPLTLISVVPPSTVLAWGNNDKSEIKVPGNLTNVIDVGAGNRFTVALRNNGHVVAWGDGSSKMTNVPPTLTNAIAIAAGETHTLALRANGTVAAWGNNSSGQTNVPAGLTDVVAIAAGGSHSVALLTNGTLVAWGSGTYSQTNVPSSPRRFVAISAGQNHTLALREDGRVTAWGRFLEGQIQVPPGLSNVVAVSAANNYSMALRSDGTLVTWGDSLAGQSNSVPSFATNIVAISVGGVHALAIQKGGTVVAWGKGTSGQTNVPASATNAVAIDGGGDHSLALIRTPVNTLVETSDHGTTTLALGTNEVISGATQALTVTSLITDGGTQYVSKGWAGSGSIPTSGTSNSVRLVVNTDSSIEWLWQTNFWLELTATGGGNLDVVDSWQASGTNRVINAMPLPGQSLVGWFGDTNDCTINGTVITVPMTVARTIEAQFTGPIPGLDQTTLDFTGQVYSAIASQVITVTNTGSGTLDFSIGSDVFWLTATPSSGTVPVGGSTTVVVNVSTRGLDVRTYQGHLTVTDTLITNSFVSASVTLGLTPVVPPTTVAAWGNNSSGQTNVPAGLTNVIALSGGGSFSLALRANGTVTAWGKNDKGQSTVPSGLANVVAMAAGEKHALALRSNGTVVPWGDNGSKQTNMPAGLTNVVAIAAGEKHSVALLSNGTVVAWGKSDKGQTNVPSGLANVISIAAGRSHALALRANGTVVAWGKNDKGQTNVPAGLSNVVAIDGGGAFSMALRADGKVVVWGDNAAGQTNVPTSMTNMVAIAAGRDFWMAKRSNGQAFAWGKNNKGQTNVPSSLSNVVWVDAGNDHALALMSVAPLGGNGGSLAAYAPHAMTAKDAWLAGNGLTESDLGKDADGDGMTALEEYIADVNPADAASMFQIVAVTTESGSSVVSFDSSADRVYTLEVLTDIESGVWTAVSGQENVPGNGGVLTLTDANPYTGGHYYRVRVALP